MREAAVRLLGEVETGAELRFLLIRLNDWVPAVRSAAQQAVQRRLKSAYAVSFARNIDLVERLLHWERADHTVLLRWIVEYLRGEEGAHAVEAALGSAGVHQRRLLYTLLLSADRDCSDALVRRALTDDDPVCRLRGIRVASRHLSGDALYDVLHRALEDSFAPVRLVAVRALAAGSFGEIEPTFITRAPSAEKVVAESARLRGETIASHGAAAANHLGITTQVPMRTVYLSSGPNRQLKLGAQSIELKHVPAWQLLLIPATVPSVPQSVRVK